MTSTRALLFLGASLTIACEGGEYTQDPGQDSPSPSEAELVEVEAEASSAALSALPLVVATGYAPAASPEPPPSPRLDVTDLFFEDRFGARPAAS